MQHFQPAWCCETTVRILACLIQFRNNIQGHDASPDHTPFFIPFGVIPTLAIDAVLVGDAQSTKENPPHALSDVHGWMNTTNLLMLPESNEVTSGEPITTTEYMACCKVHDVLIKICDTIFLETEC